MIKHVITVSMAILFLSCASSNNKNRKVSSEKSVGYYTSSLLDITAHEGELTLFGIKWNDLLNQELYPAEVFKNPRESLVIKKLPTPEQVYNNYEDLVKLIERNLTFRAKAVSFLDDLNKHRIIKKREMAVCVKKSTSRKEKKACKDKKIVMSPAQTTALTNGAKEFLLLRYLNTYVTKLYMSKAKVILETQIRHLGEVNLNDRELVEVFISLAAALTLYDNYVLMVEQFERDFEINRIFKAGIDTLGIPSDVIERISKNSRKIKYRVDINRVVEWLERENFQLKPNEYNELDKAYNYLLTYINSTAGYKIFKRSYLVNMWEVIYRRVWQGVVIAGIQRAVGAERNVANELSEAFGNTVGLIESRKGYMYLGHNGKVSKKIKKVGFRKVSLQKRKDYHLKIREMLKPGDVLLEKTPFRLTDKFIPGHWGHVAVWTGTITDLKEAKLWDLVQDTREWLSLRKDQKAYIMESLKDNPEDPIKDRAILEALRPGVQLNDLYHFLNVDDVAILRPKLEGKTDLERRSEMAEIIANGFTHVLKDYDFNFDVRDTNKIVCSELAWHTYTNCHFKTQVIASRASINPDDVADAVFGDVNGKSCFSTSYIVHDGEEVDPKEYNLDEALKSLNLKSSLN